MRAFLVLFFSLFLVVSLEGRKEVSSYTTPIANENVITILEGNRPIIISVPHAMEVPRKKRSPYADRGTGELAVMLHERCDVTVIYLSSNADWNPSASDDNLYKDALARLILTKRPELVIDLHRAHRRRPFDIDYGTLHGVSCSDKTIEDLTKCLREKGIKEFSSNFFSASKQPTVTKWAYHHGIRAVQLEINGRWLRLNGNDEDRSRFSQLREGLSTFLLSF